MAVPRSIYPVMDASVDLTHSAHQLATMGVKGVMRYYNPIGLSKRLTKSEAQALTSAGLLIGIVVEGYGGTHGSGVDATSGARDARGVLNWLPSTGATVTPELCVYFAVDVDADAGYINSKVVPYFDAINEVFNAISASKRPRVGVYGEGWVCHTLQDTQRAACGWLAMSTGWEHYVSYLNSNKWSLVQAGVPRGYFPVDADGNKVQGNDLSKAGLIKFGTTSAEPPVHPVGANPPGGPAGKEDKSLWQSLKDGWKRL